MSDSPDLSPEDVREILRLIDESGYDEFELETPRFSVRYTRPTAETAVENSREEAASRPADLVDVSSPMVGTLYRASAPGAPPFVEVGDRVREDTALCIIEVMKLMSTVSAGVVGEIAEICVQNGAPVQYGDVLFRVRPDA